MKQLTQLLIAILFASSCLILSSCQDLLVKTLEVEDFDYEKQLAISGSLISTDDEFTLLISENQAITDPADQWQPAEDAVATLYRGETELGQLEFGEVSNTGLENLFTLDVESIDLSPGSYRLEVEHPTLGMAVAETEIPTDIQIDNIEFIENYGIAPNDLTRADALLVTFNDPPEDNYYSLKLERDSITIDTFIYGVDTFIYQTNDYIWVDFDLQGAQSVTNGFLFDDSFLVDGENSVAMYLPGLEYQENVEEYLSSFKLTWDVISRDKFEFDRSLNLYFESQGFGPFTEAVSIYNNIEGGVGIFSGLNRTFYPIP